MRTTPSALLFTLLIASALPAQTPRRLAPAANPQANRLQLPVTRVSLYKNGVGFFEHAGRVTGNQSVSIEFTTAQLNDVLQSLTAIDLNGGRIAGAGYNSTTPIEQQLKALPLGLGEDPSTVDFYNAIRGARVEIHTATGAFTGRLLNIELRITPEKDNQSDPSGGIETRFLTVISDTGAIRTLQVTPTTEVRLLRSDDNQLTYILNESGRNPQLTQALQPILEARRRFADAQTSLNAVNERLAALRAEEERQRANVVALKDADKSVRQRFVNELNQSEDQITLQQKDFTTRDAELKSDQQDLADKITTLQVNETL